MFCLMDVSGSMSEHMKDLAKRFYMLLYVFLKRRAHFRQVEIVFNSPYRPGQQKSTRTHSSTDRHRAAHWYRSACRDARDRPRTLSPGRLEYLCRAGLGRRQHALRQFADGQLLTDKILPIAKVLPIWRSARPPTTPSTCLVVAVDAV